MRLQIRALPLASLEFTSVPLNFFNLFLSIQTRYLFAKTLRSNENNFLSYHKQSSLRPFINHYKK